MKTGMENSPWVGSPRQLSEKARQSSLHGDDWRSDEWHKLSESYPELMQPAKDAQLIIRKKTFGLRFWAKKTKFRNDTYKFQNVFRCV